MHVFACTTNCGNISSISLCTEQQSITTVFCVQNDKRNCVSCTFKHILRCLTLNPNVPFSSGDCIFSIRVDGIYNAEIDSHGKRPSMGRHHTTFLQQLRGLYRVRPSEPADAFLFTLRSPRRRPRRLSHTVSVSPKPFNVAKRGLILTNI